jgi:DNA damage-binding protein 1
MVACCGMNKEGSIRIVRNGIGVVDIADLDMNGLQHLWSLRNVLHDE